MLSFFLATGLGWPESLEVDLLRCSFLELDSIECEWDDALQWAEQLGYMAFL